MKSHNNISAIILISLFLLLLLIPNIIMVFEITSKKDNYSFPEISLKNPKETLSGLKNFYLNNFGLKDLFLNNYLNIKNTHLKENPIPNSVFKGRNGWYFLGNQYNNVINDAFGNDNFTDKEVHKITQNIKDINNYLSSKNIKFYLVIPPNKSSIYKEELPFKLLQNENKLTVLKNNLINEINFNIIDLTDTLLASKKEAQLYHKTDSHWNDIGAFIGYSKTIKEISKDIQVPLANKSSFNITTKINNKNDLTDLINDTVESKTVVFDQNNVIKPESYSKDYEHYINPEKSLKLIMHKDSYSIAWVKYFVESFGSIYFLDNYKLDKKLIEKTKPDIIIFELIERDIDILSK